MFNRAARASNDNRFEHSLVAPVNRVSLSGRLAGEPQVRVTGSGHWIVHLLLTTDDDLEGTTSSENAGLVRVVVVDDGLARFAGTRLAQAQRIHVEGQLQTRPGANSSGEPLVTTEVVLSGRRAALVPLDEQREFF